MANWQNTLRRGQPLITDGGTGTELRRRGVPFDAAAWSGRAPLTHFDTLRAIHSDYIAAGADVITTSTFGTSRFVLEAAGLDEVFDTINRRAVAAAREARDAAGRDVAIAGAISCLPPRFDSSAYPEPALEEAAYRELAELLAMQGVDIIALEMMEDPVHAARACASARAVGLPIWLGISCRIERGALVAYDFPKISLEQCLDALLPFAPAAVIVMHTPPDAIAPALEAIRERFAGSLGVRPELGDGTAPAALTPQAFADRSREWIAAGATIVGGCCGTTPEHIRALVEAFP